MMLMMILVDNDIVVIITSISYNCDDDNVMMNRLLIY